MNGLLHRIAARAAGTALAVRADIAPAYAAGGAAFGAMADAHDEAPPPVALHAEPHAPAVQRAAGTSEAGAGPAFAAAADASAMVPASTPVPVAMAGAAAVGANVGTVPRQPLRPGPEQPGAPGVEPTAFGTVSSGTRPEPPQPAAMLARHDAVATSMASAPSPLDRGVFETAPPAAVRPAAGTRGTGEPAPLMPHAPAAAAPAPFAVASIRPDGAHRRGTGVVGTAAAGADTEVHIHIGRIDVTAVQAATPQRRRPPAAAAPMSLDGYLAKRGRA